MPSPSSLLRGAALLVVSIATQNVRSQDSQPTGPTMPNIAANCNKFHTVKAGVDESCFTVSKSFGITLDQFYKWNPDVTTNCGANFWPGYAYCVGVDPSKPTTRPHTTSKPTTTTTTTTTTPKTSSTTSKATSTASGSGSQSSSSVPPNTEPYSTRYPVTSQNVTATSVESTFPPQRTQPGQPATCNDWYLPSPGDTCDTIVASSSWLTLEDLLKWNPTLGSDCSGLYAGWWLCTSSRVENVTVSFGWTTTAVTASIPPFTGNYTPTTFPTIDPSFTPTPTPDGTTKNCQAYWQAQDGDTCKAIVDGNILTEEEFYKLNPVLKGNCKGLWVNYYYCVIGPDGVSAMPPTATAPPSSMPSGQTADCTSWYQRDGESCDDLVAIFGTFSRADFIKWNPSVGSDCNNVVDWTWYCVGVPGTPTTRTKPLPTTSIPSAPTQSGTAGNCSRLWLVSPTDTCDSIAKANGISQDQFLKWNPALGKVSCDSLVPDFYVCVQVGGSTTSEPGRSTTTTPQGTTTTDKPTTTGGATTTSSGTPVNTPLPVQGGMVSGCRRFYKAQKDDGCWDIATAAGISPNDFAKWNPAVGADCKGLWPDYYYCIGITGPATTISSGPAKPT